MKLDGLPSFLNLFADFLNRFTDQWLVTRRAAALFFLSTIYLMPLTVLLLHGIDIAHRSEGYKFALDLSGSIGAIAVFFLWFGMLRFWMRLDRSPRWPHRLWLIILVLGFWIGACFYCLIVYLPNIVRGNLRDRSGQAN
jgi:hypothetical protein